MEAQGTKAVMGGEVSGSQALVIGRGERFDCPRCGYARSLKRGEDGFRLYVLHEERCSPTMGRQLWFRFITEDDLNWSSWEEKRMLLFPAPSGDPTLLDGLNTISHARHSNGAMRT
jgi:hypothetical protein